MEQNLRVPIQRKILYLICDQKNIRSRLKNYGYFCAMQTFMERVTNWRCFLNRSTITDKWRQTRYWDTIQTKSRYLYINVWKNIYFPFIERQRRFFIVPILVNIHAIVLPPSQLFHHKGQTKLATAHKYK